MCSLCSQVELRGEFIQTRDPTLFAGVVTITDLCLRVQCSAVQATGKIMATMVLQERTCWLSLTDLTDHEKHDLLDMPVIPEGIFVSAVASMQCHCEAKRKEDEALQLCLPCIPMVPPRQPQCRAPTSAAATQPPQFQILKQPKQALNPPGSASLPLLYRPRQLVQLRLAPPGPGGRIMQPDWPSSHRC